MSGVASPFSGTRHSSFKSFDSKILKCVAQHDHAHAALAHRSPPTSILGKNTTTVRISIINSYLRSGISYGYYSIACSIACSIDTITNITIDLSDR